MSNFREKYLKYKKKYIEFKNNQVGGGNIDIVCFDEAKGLYAPLSNFFMIDFMFNNKPFANSEQAFCWMKASHFKYDQRVLDYILTIKDPERIKMIGSGDEDVLNEKNEPVRIGAGFGKADWDAWAAVNDKIIFDILLEKFRPTNPARRAIFDVLNNTGNMILVEAYWADASWGIGYDENGVIPNNEGGNLPPNEKFAAKNNMVWINNETLKWLKPEYERDIDGNPIHYKLDVNRNIIYQRDRDGNLLYAGNRLGKALADVRTELRKLYPLPLPPGRDASFASGIF